jgi:hypothetical protein
VRGGSEGGGREVVKGMGSGKKKEQKINRAKNLQDAE